MADQTTNFAHRFATRETVMTHAHPRTSAAAAFGLAGCLLLAGCNSAAPAPAAHTDTPAVQATAGVNSASPADATSTAGTPIGATSAAASSGDTTACTLVTEQEVGTALGTDPGPGSPFTSHGSSQCQYGSYQTAFVLVNLTPTQGKAAYDLMHNNPKVGNAGAVVDVAGVGDRAFEISGPNTASIYFNNGDALVLVTVEIRTATSPPKDQALALATAAASRI
jgi:hypothetical protein